LRIVAVIGDTNHFEIFHAVDLSSVSVAEGIEDELPIIIPAVNLEVLCGVEAHFSGLVTVERVAHETCMIGVRLRVETTRMC